MNREAALKQIDDVLKQTSQITEDTQLNQTKAEYTTEMLISTISRFVAPNSSYLAKIEYLRRKETTSYPGYIIPALNGLLQSVRRDIDQGYVERFAGLVRADTFSDFLSMSDHLLNEGYKDPAAVLAGSVLEQHLRSLCDVSGIDTNMPDGRWKKADTLNSELVKANVYTKLDQKNITSWLGLRNEAAHGNYGGYAAANVRLMIDGISFFMLQHPA